MNKYILIGLVLVLVTFTMVPTNTIRNVYGHEDNYRPWFDARDFYNYVDRYDCYKDECGGDRYYYKHYDDGECYPRYPGDYYDRDCREYYYDRCYDDRYDCGDDNHHDDEREYKYEDNREYTYKYKYDDDDHYKDSKIKIYGDDDHHDDDHDD